MNKANHFFIAGFTLIELMITIALIAILAGIALPSFQESIANNRQITSVNMFTNSLAVARSEAIKRGANVTVCPGSTGTTCGSSNFKDGWVTFSDTSTQGTLDGTDVIVKNQGAVPGTITMALGVGTSITFNSSGFALAANTLTVCDDRTGETGRVITISRSGSTSVATSPCL